MLETAVFAAQPARMMNVVNTGGISRITVGGRLFQDGSAGEYGSTYLEGRTQPTCLPGCCELSTRDPTCRRPG